MRSLTLTRAALLALVSAAVLSAQTVIRPGQLAAVPDVAASLPETAGAGIAAYDLEKTSIAHVEDRQDRILNRVWVASMFAAVAATGLDAATSWGKQEANGFLASSDGTFGAKALSIKAGFAAGLIAPQLLLRKHKNLKMAFAIGNFSEAAIFSAVSVHNLRISPDR